MTEENGRFYSFESFRVDPARRRLSRNGEFVPIHSKTFDLLLALIENRGRTVEKDELMNLVWANQIVEEGNLTVKMSALRKTLGERKDEARFIVTVPGKGYRFVADVRQTDASEDDALVIERHAVTRITVEEEIESDAEDSPMHAANANGHATEGIADSPPESFQPYSATRLSSTALQNTPGVARTAPAVKSKSGARLRYSFVALATAVVAIVSATFAYRFGASQDSKNALTPVSFQQAAFKRLTTSGRVAGATISPDGKYFVFAQRETEGQSLWVRQIAESRQIEIMPTGAREYWGLTFTPDGAHIYATVFTPNKAELDLLRVPTLGGAVERLPNIVTSAVSFSPDGKRFAYINPNSAAGVVLLRVANADGSDDKILATIKYPSYFVSQGKTLAWSPDGDVIACATKLVDEQGDYGTLMGVRVRDGSMFPMLARRFPWIGNVAWLGREGGLAITANETAATPMQLWHLSYPGGEVQKLSNDLDRYSWASTTSDGEKLIAVNQTTASSLWVADYGNGEVVAPQRIANEIVDYGEIAWTTSGEIIHRSAASGAFNLWRVGADGTNPAQLTTNGMPDKGLSVSPDNRYIVFSSYRAGKYNLWRTDIDGANPVQLTDGAGEVYPRITPDSRWVIYQQGTGQTKCTLWRMPIEGGTHEQITKTHTVFPTLAPDGAHVAYFFMDNTQAKRRWRIGVARTADGALTHSFDLPENISGRVARWTPDGAALVYARSNGEVGSLWRQPLDSSPPIQMTRFNGEPIENFAWSPDGRRLAFTRSTAVSDVTLVEKFR